MCRLHQGDGAGNPSDSTPHCLGSLKDSGTQALKVGGTHLECEAEGGCRVRFSCLCCQGWGKAEAGGWGGVSGEGTGRCWNNPGCPGCTSGWRETDRTWGGRPHPCLAWASRAWRAGPAFLVRQGSAFPVLSPRLAAMLGAKVGTGTRESLPMTVSRPARIHSMGQASLTSRGYRTRGNLEGPAHSPLALKPSLPDGRRSAVECPRPSPRSLKLMGTDSWPPHLLLGPLLLRLRGQGNERRSPGQHISAPGEAKSHGRAGGGFLPAEPTNSGAGRMGEESPD